MTAAGRGKSDSETMTVRFAAKWSSWFIPLHPRQGPRFRVSLQDHTVRPPPWPAPCSWRMRALAALDRCRDRHDRGPRGEAQEAACADGSGSRVHSRAISGRSQHPVLFVAGNQFDSGSVPAIAPVFATAFVAQNSWDAFLSTSPLRPVLGLQRISPRRSRGMVAQQAGVTVTAHAGTINGSFG